MKVSQGDP